MITCKRATELISKSVDDKLSWPETVTLRLHLFICEFCEQFKKQLSLIQRMIGVARNEAESDHGQARPSLSAEDKRKILDKINRDLKDTP